MTPRTMTRLAAAGFMTAGLLAGMSSVNTAASASIDLSATNFNDASGAWSALEAFRSGQKDYVAEDFEGFSVGTLTNPSGLDAGGGRNNTSEFLDTNVGQFYNGPDAVAGTGACTQSGDASDCNSAGILNSAETPFSGRFDSTGGDDSSDDTSANGSEDQGKWLDSNDTTQIVWDADLDRDEIDLGNGRKISGLGVILTDVTDVGATFEVSLKGASVTSTENFSGLGNGTFTLVTARFRNFLPPITSFQATFENKNGKTNDGFGIDDATIAVPAPATLGLLGLGLIGVGVAARRRNRTV